MTITELIKQGTGYELSKFKRQCKVIKSKLEK